MIYVSKDKWSLSNRSLVSKAQIRTFGPKAQFKLREHKAKQRIFCTKTASYLLSIEADEKSEKVFVLTPTI